IIGRIGVRVHPVTNRFRGEARRELKKIQKTMGDLKVKVVPDTKGTRAAVERAVKEAQATLDQDKLKLRFEHDDFDEIQSAIDQIDEALRDKRRISIEVDKQSQEELLAMRDLLKDAQRESVIGIEVTNDLAGLEEAKRELKSRLERFEPKGTVVAEGNEASIRAERKKLRAQIDAANLRAKIKVEQDRLRELVTTARQISSLTSWSPIDIEEGQRNLRELRQQMRSMDKANIRVGADTLQAEIELSRFLAEHENDQFDIQAKIDLKNRLLKEAEEAGKAFEKAWADATKKRQQQMDKEIADRDKALKDWYDKWYNVERDLR